MFTYGWTLLTHSSSVYRYYYKINGAYPFVLFSALVIGMLLSVKSLLSDMQ